MASAAAQVPIFKELRCFSNEKPLLWGHVARSRNNLVMPRQSIKDLPVLTFARRRGTASKSTSVSSKKLTKKQNLHSKSTPDDEDEDAFEALFQQLEEDLKNDNVSIDERDDDINEDDIAQLEAELEEALKDDELLGALGSTGDTKEEYESESGVDEEGSDDYQNSFNDQEPDDEGDDEESFENLRTWQVKRLAYALKNGRRKSSIKNLAAELCLDRAIVLRLLRDPPPDLLMLSAALPDNPVSRILEPKNESIEIASLETATSNSRAEAKSKLPVHVMQRNWSAQKRLKRAQRETLEKVYGRTKRPTNAMISSIVQVTHLPRKRVVKWFEDKRTEDGVPDHRVPYQRSADAQLQ